MGQDAFLKLLVTQLQNQDPMQPMQDKEFIAQMAQFASLEQMQQMNQNLQFFTQGFLDSQSGYQAVTLIGRTILAIDPEDSELTIAGKVESVRFENGVALLKIGDKEVPVSNVMQVEQSFLDSQSGYQAMSLVGRTVTAVDPHDSEKTVEGAVESVSFTNGLALLRIGDRDIPVDLVTKVK